MGRAPGVDRVRAPEQRVDCWHCGLPVPAGLIERGAERQFCCDGCRTVFAILHESGLERFYEHRERAGSLRRAAKTTGKSYAEFDDPSFEQLYCRALPNGLMSVDLLVEGVHCSACVWLVERVPLVAPGAVEARLDIGRSVVHLVWDPRETRLSRVARALDSLGYPPHPEQGARAGEIRRREQRALLGKMAVAGAAAGNVMLMAFALYSGAFVGMDPRYVALFRWGSFAVTVPAVLWSGSVFFKGAWAAIRTRTPHMDLPISLGILAGFVWGTISTFRSRGDVYFDSVTALIFLLLVGRWLLNRQQHAARDAAELLHSLAPRTARLVEGGEVREVPLEAVPLGAELEVRAGEHVAADGVVTSGQSSLDASLLTGESRPEEVGPGSRVHAGSINLSAPLRLRAEATGESSRIGRLMKSVEEAARRRAPVVRLADRVSGYFVLIVLALAALTFVFWWRLDPAHAAEHAVALLVVACPCALGLGTPLAVSAALGRAARSGILIKGGDALEQLGRPALVVFDKTGTLTEGRLTLLAWRGDDSVKPLVSAAEARSAHPLARAFVRALGDPGELAVSDYTETLGGGLSASVAGRRVVIGSAAYVGGLGARVPSWVADELGRQTARASSPVLIAVDGQVRALAAFGDPVRADAHASLRELRALGYRLAILSGDHPDVVQAVARQLGVPPSDARGAASPEDKLEYVQAAARRGPVLMVGDGVNDAAALTAATVGVAMHGGAEASLAVADVFTTRAGVAPLVELVRGARATLRVIHRNLALSLLYNLIAVSFAALGLIGPLLAAVLMPLSSLAVVTSSFQSKTFGVRRVRRETLPAPVLAPTTSGVPI